jgi:hypothetical protein
MMTNPYKDKSAWRIVAFPIFAVIAALSLPLICALSAVGVPDWVLIVMDIVWVLGFFPALWLLVEWMI